MHVREKALVICDFTRHHTSMHATTVWALPEKRTVIQQHIASHKTCTHEGLFTKLTPRSHAQEVAKRRGVRLLVNGVHLLVSGVRLLASGD